MAALSLDFNSLKSAYKTGVLPAEVIQRLYPRIAAEHGMFITLLPLEDLLDRCRYITKANVLSGHSLTFDGLTCWVFLCVRWERQCMPHDDLGMTLGHQSISQSLLTPISERRILTR